MNTLFPLVFDLCDFNRHSTEERDVEVLDASDLEDYVSDHVMSEDELKEHLMRFYRHCERLDQPMTEADEVRQFSRFFNAMQEALMSVGTFSESRIDEADFTARRDVDPTHVLRVKTSRPMTSELAMTTLAACLSMGTDYAVIFDGSEGRTVLFSNGNLVREE